MCDLYSVPEEQKVQRFKSHLEGSVLVHANSWIDAQDDQEYTYRDLVKELKFQFQKSVREDEAELKLIGRKWNIFDQNIEEFVREVRTLVQQAYPKEQKRWDNRIKTSIKLALPSELVRHISAQDTKGVAEISDWIRSNMGHIKRDEEPKEGAEKWILDAYRSSQKSKSKKNNEPAKVTDLGGGNKNAQMNLNTDHNPENQRDGNAPPRFTGQCYECGSYNHRRVNCPRFNHNGGNNGGGRGNWNNQGFNNQRQSWNNNANSNTNQNWRNNTGQNQWGNAPNQGGYQGNRGQDNNQRRNWYEQPYQGNQRYQPQNQNAGNWNNNTGNQSHRPPTQQNQGSTGSNNMPQPGVRVVGATEEQPKPEESTQSEGLAPDSTTSPPLQTETRTGNSILSSNEIGDAQLSGYPKPESCGVNPKVVQMLDQRNWRGMNGGITNGGGRSDGSDG
ncbi:MAG: hypothetical protein GY820_07410 [Gammaproteobacteria bacterium]|nr:hypothetical protein [Gammaproteobacteria bacterium]